MTKHMQKAETIERNIWIAIYICTSIFIIFFVFGIICYHENKIIGTDIVFVWTQFIIPLGIPLLALGCIGVVHSPKNHSKIARKEKEVKEHVEKHTMLWHIAHRFHKPQF